MRLLNKNFKDKLKSPTVGKKSARNLIYLVSSLIFFESKTDVSFGFEADVVFALRLNSAVARVIGSLSMSRF